MKHRKIIIGTCIAVAAAVGAVSVNVSAGTAINTAVASKGALDCELELNGTVESLEEETYYSKISGRIGGVPVKEGDLVTVGQLLISYDTKDLSMEQTLAELDEAADQGTYDDTKQYGGRVAGLYSEAKNTLPELEHQIQMTEAVIITTQKELTDRKSELSAVGAQLQADLACCVAGEGDDPEEVQKARENIECRIAQNAHDQQYDPFITQKQDELSYLNYLMTSYKEKKSVMESQKSQTQLNLQTEGAKDRLEAEKAAGDLVNEMRLEDLAVASEGVRAGISGVVTKVAVTEGCSVSEGQELIEIRSLRDVAVVCHVNKYDIVNIEEGQTASAYIKNKDYPCKVSRIEKMTRDDEKTPGIRVELAIDEPDEDIILGIEAKTKVRTAAIAYALLVPTEAVYSDDEGDYVFVIEDGRAQRRSVTAGIRNDDLVEICDGLSEGEIVGWDDMSELTDDQKVKVR